LLLVALTMTVAGNPALPTLVPVAVYDTGLGANGAEIISVRDTDGIAAITNIAGNVDVLDLSDPTNPQLLLRVPIDTTTGSPNSVAVHPQHDYFLVVTGRAGLTGTVAAHRLTDGALLGSAPTGIQPDSVNITPNGQFAVIANEAESPGAGQNGGDGSLTVVDLSGFNGTGPGEFHVTQVPLPSLSGVPGLSTGRTDDLGLFAIDNAPPSLEPESVAFSPDSRFAYVTLQENNGVVRLDLHSGALMVVGLGTVTHFADLSTSGGYNPVSLLTSFREPDGIALDKTGRFFVTADEGDTRNSVGASGPRGGRTVSVFDASSGALLGDTGSQLDDAAAAAGSYPDNRSHRGGSEPEVLDLTEHRSRTIVAVGLERANRVALIDVSDPARPTVFATAPVGLQPEGVKFLRRGGRLFVVSANEGAGTVSVLEVID
jgi:DNA-binding beta-propeller fold protein YncE